MRRWSLATVITTVACLLGAGAYWAWQRSAPLGVLTIAATGKPVAFWLQESVTLPITLRNPTWRAIHVTEFRASCNCTSVVPAEVSVPARSTTQVAVTIKLVPGSHGWNDQGQAEFAVDIEPIYANSLGKRVQPWRLKIPLKTSFDHPGTWRWQEEVVRGEEVVMELPVKMFDICGDLQLVDSPSYGTASVQIDHARRKVVFRYVPHGDQPAGDRHDRLVVQPFDKHGQPLPRVPLPITFHVVPSVAVDPPVLTRLADRGSQVTWNIRLLSRRNRPFRIAQLSSSPRLLVDPSWEELAHGEPRALWQIAVSHDVAYKGSFNDALVIQTVSVGEPLVKETLTIPVSVYGVTKEGD